ncbi:MAG: PHP-associated domain-containing protein, partial [Chloroflexota bacterium]
MSRSFVDLHTHSKGSFDSLASPRDMVKAAVDRGLTHLAITDHDRVDVAQEARALGSSGLTVIVGEEVKSRDGDLICLFLERAIPPGLSAMETIAAAREQGALVGIPHPFDRMRGSLLRDAAMASLAPHVDWVEAHNARLVGHGNEDAAAFAREHDLPGIAVSDAHSVMEIGVAYMALDGDPSTPAGLLAALRTLEIVPGRASYFVRLWTPVAKGMNRVRGNGRIQPIPT